MAKEYPHRFGRYLVLDHLVDGGMAKICRARFLGEQADKLVAIKMIQSQFSKDPSFKKMFLDEIKVTFGLNHPHIAQIYEYGMVEGQLYQAMEYVDGANLKQVLDRLKKRNFVFPVEISLHIIGQVCQALGYAHNFTDTLTGTKLKIIHRDISPHNIMITYDGAVKVIDFGIAKAETNSEETKAGIIKGKISYIAPEYLDGDILDPRYDLFAVGVTLWELLCGRKLFTAPNELAILKKIQTCKIPPPSTINPNVSEELDNIILKSLARNREDRYEDMDQFNRALVKYLFAKYPDFNPSDLSHFGQELFKEDIKKDRVLFQEYGKIDTLPYLKELESEGADANTIDKNQGGEIELEISEEDSIDIEQAALPKAKPKVNLILKGEKEVRKTHDKTQKISKKVLSDSPQKNTPSFELEKSSTEKTRVGHLKKGMTTIKKVQMSSETNANIWENPYVRMAIMAAIIIAFESKTKIVSNLLSVNTGKAQKRVPAAEVEEEDVKQQFQRVTFTNTMPFQRFYLNQNEVELDRGGVDFPLNRKATFRVEQDGHIPIFIDYIATVDSDNHIRLPNQEMGSFGILQILGEYPTGTTFTYYLGDRKITYKLPKEEVQILVGTYDAQLRMGHTGLTREVNIIIKEDSVTKLRKR